MNVEAAARLDALSADILAYLNHAPTSEFNGQAVQVLAQWEGADNLLWRVAPQGAKQEAVLKLYLDAGQARSRRQFDGQQILAPLGVAPRPLWYDRYPQGLSRQIMVYEWAPGQLLDVTNPAQVTALAQAVAQVHGAEVDAWRRFSPNPFNLDTLWRVQQGSVLYAGGWLAAHSPSLAHLFQQLAADAQRLVKAALPLWRNAAPAPVHGDLKLENCLYSLGAALLVDWELCGLGDAALDAASFLYWNRQALSADARSRWLDDYLAYSADEELAQRIGVYERLLPFQSLCYLLDGLRNFGANAGDTRTAPPNEFEGARHFLQETLYASYLEAAHSLSLEIADPALPIEELFAALTAGRAG